MLNRGGYQPRRHRTVGCSARYRGNLTAKKDDGPGIELASDHGIGFGGVT